MRAFLQHAGVALSMIAAAAVLCLATDARPTRAADNGPTLQVGTPTLQGGNVAVPILASGSGFAPFAGFNIHLRWDPALFRLSGATSARGAFDATAGRAICLGPSTNQYDADGGGMVFACALTSPEGSTASVSTAALLATVTLTPKGGGCSQLHLTTVGGADGGDENSGSLTNSVDTGAAQTNQYVDSAVDTNGQPCTGAPPVRPAITPEPVSPDSTVPVEASTSSAPPPDAGAPSATAQPAGTPVAGSPGSATPASNGTAALTQTIASGTSTPPSGTIGDQPASSKGGGGGSSGVIIGIIVAVGAVAAAAAGGYLIYRRRLAG